MQNSSSLSEALAHTQTLVEDPTSSILLRAETTPCGPVTGIFRTLPPVEVQWISSVTTSTTAFTEMTGKFRKMHVYSYTSLTWVKDEKRFSIVDISGNVTCEFSLKSMLT